MFSYFNLIQKLWEKNRRISELEEPLEKQEKLFRLTEEFYEEYQDYIEDKL